MVVINNVTNMFWGITVDAGKRYSQVVNDGFHLSMAALEHGTGNDFVQVMLQHESSEFLLCTLQHGKLLQQPLDLVFSAGEEVSFSLTGKGVVHLTGYLLNDEPEMDELEDDEDAPDLVDVSDESLLTGKKRKALQQMLENSKKFKMSEDDDEDDEDEDDEDEDEMDDEFSEDDLSFDDDDEDEEDEHEEDDDDDDDEEEEDEEALAKAKLAAQKLFAKKNKSLSKSTPGSTPKEGQAGKEQKKTPQAKVETPKSGKQKQQNATTPVSVKKDKNQQQQTPVTTPKTPENGESPTKKKKKKNKKKKQDGDESMNNSTNSTPGSTPKSESKAKVEVTPKKKVVAGGTVVEDTKVGHGPEAKPGKMASVYYSGTLAKNNKRFDSCLAGKPFRFRLGQGEVIKGWDNGVNGMKVGGKRKITVPANQAYGNVRQGPIPPNSSLVFEVELKAVS